MEENNDDNTDETRRAEKPGFFVDRSDEPGTARRLIELLIEHTELYERGGVMVTLQVEKNSGRLEATPVTPADVMVAIHGIRQPYVIKKNRDGSTCRENITIPDRVTRIALTRETIKPLPPLRGISHAPLLGEGGSIHCLQGYDPGSGMFCFNVPDVNVPDQPTRDCAESAFRRIRLRLRTFPFADATRTRVDEVEEPVVDIELPPGVDESAYIVALLTAVCRPSLDRVPGLVISAPPLSGAGSGKGLLVRFLSTVAYGLEPNAMTTGNNVDEMDKRLASELIRATPIVFLDNVNDTELRSDLLASAITESTAQIRLLRTNTLTPLNQKTFICVTGNGTRTTEDLGRRFSEVRLNPGVENPEARKFSGNFLEEARQDRGEILSDLLTIIRWGAQQGDALVRGRPLGSFEAWGMSCRDVILALGGADVVAEMAKRQANDSVRSETRELFAIWWQYHADKPMQANQLHEEVWRALTANGETRQKIAVKLPRMNDTVCGAFRFKVIPRDPESNWGKNKFKLECINPALLDRGHRIDGGAAGPDEIAASDDFADLRGNVQRLPARSPIRRQ